MLPLDTQLEPSSKSDDLMTPGNTIRPSSDGVAISLSTLPSMHGENNIIIHALI